MRHRERCDPGSGADAATGECGAAGRAELAVLRPRRFMALLVPQPAVRRSAEASVRHDQAGGGETVGDYWAGRVQGQPGVGGGAAGVQPVLQQEVPAEGAEEQRVPGQHHPILRVLRAVDAGARVPVQPAVLRAVPLQSQQVPAAILAVVGAAGAAAAEQRRVLHLPRLPRAGHPLQLQLPVPLPVPALSSHAAADVLHGLQQLHHLLLRVPEAGLLLPRQHVPAAELLHAHDHLLRAEADGERAGARAVLRPLLPPAPPAPAGRARWAAHDAPLRARLRQPQEQVAAGPRSPVQQFLRVPQRPDPLQNGLLPRLPHHHH